MALLSVASNKKLAYIAQIKCGVVFLHVYSSGKKYNIAFFFSHC